MDIGTGSGIWAIDMADQYPSAEVIGVDLSPIQPSWVPPNLKFEVDDMEDEWTYQRDSFDMIFIRHMAGFLYDWPKLYRQAFKALKPGGWIELQDFCDFFCADDDSLPPNSTILEFESYWEKGTNDCGREWKRAAPSMEPGLKEVGYVDVRVIRQQCLNGVDGVSLALFTRVIGWEKEKFDAYMKNVHADLANPNIHMYSKFYRVWGRKPLSL
ncbi:hypothetical protein RUND412_009076 [Rhizina undulata]